MDTRILFAAMAMAAVTGAQAVRAQPAPARTWTGFYVGGNVGVSWPNSSFSNVVTTGGGLVVAPPADIAAINSSGPVGPLSSGLTGGIEGGYNYQVGQWLLGVETDFDYMNTRQSQTIAFQSALPNINPPIQAALNERIKTNWLWTIRPRVGYVMGPALVYVTGGLAMTNPSLTVQYADTRSTSDTAVSSSSNSRLGGTVGAGAAWMLAPHWSVKGEYLYNTFGGLSTIASSPNGYLILRTKGDVSNNLLRFGVDYAF